MARQRAERRKSYLELISGKYGLEKTLNEISSVSGGFESMESPMVSGARNSLEAVLRGREPSPTETYPLAEIEEMTGSSSQASSRRRINTIWCSVRRWR